MEQLPKRGRRRQYTADVKRRVLAYRERRLADGASEATACKELGLDQSTVVQWRSGRRTQKRRSGRGDIVRPVEVAAPRTGQLVLVLPGDARVEGLSLEQVVQLAKALR